MLELLIALGWLVDALLYPRFVAGVVLTIVGGSAMYHLLPAGNLRDLLICQLGTAGIVGSIICESKNEKPPEQPPD